jgi:threonine/homoserine/homoserine lactone efflux protein
MEIELFLKGLLIGFIVSVPLGAIGLLCVQRTLNKGRKSGFFSGLGAASADTIYALIAGLGISIVISFIKEQDVYFRIIAGIIIITLGISIFLKNPVRQ